jgi:acyl carrier protein
MGGLDPARGMKTARSAEVLESLLLWLNERMAPEGVVIEADTPLFKGLIDSIRIRELIAWTEREVGRTIPDHQILMQNFSTPRRIAEVYADT